MGQYAGPLTLLMAIILGLVSGFIGYKIKEFEIKGKESPPLSEVAS